VKIAVFVFDRTGDERDEKDQRDGIDFFYFISSQRANMFPSVSLIRA
jgi:hypothetical protein